MSNEFLTREQAAEWLRQNYGVGSHSRLACMATTGEGPSFRRFGGRAIYEIADLKQWAEARFSKKVRATSELTREAS